MRVTALIVRSEDDTQIWSERYDRVIEDIFAVQSEIAERVAQQLDLTLLEPERQALSAHPTTDLEAYDLYLRGREHEDNGWAYQDLDEFDRAIELLEEAVERDPDFALPYVRLSYIHSRMYFFSVDRSEERLTKARETVERALAYGLTDLDRIERMVLKTVANEFFRLPGLDDSDEHENG